MANKSPTLRGKKKPEIYGNQRTESYKKGYNQAFTDLLANLNKEK